MFLVIAKKSMSFSVFQCLTNEQVYKRWEGAEPGSEPKLANGNIPCHGHLVQFINEGWRGAGTLFSGSLIFS